MRVRVYVCKCVGVNMSNSAAIFPLPGLDCSAKVQQIYY